MEFTIGSIHCYGVLGSLSPLWAYEPVMKNVIAAVGGCGLWPLRGLGGFAPPMKNGSIHFSFLLGFWGYMTIFVVFFFFSCVASCLSNGDLRGRSISVNGVLLRLVDADPCAETIFCLQPELVQA